MRFMLMFVVVLFTFSGCKKWTLNKTEKCLTDGEWSIFLYSENGVNKTDKGYSEYTFTFNNEGGLNARISSLSVNLPGIYEMQKVDKTPVMKITIQNPLESLNEDWEIVDQNKSKVELRTTNTANKRLVFLKKK